MCQKYSVKWKKKSRYNLPKIKDETYIINLDEYELIGTYWVAFYVKTSNGATYFDNVGVEQIPLSPPTPPPPHPTFLRKRKEKKSIGNRNTTTNIFRIQAYNSVICRYFCTGFIDFILKGKSLLEDTNSFCPRKYEKNDKIMLKYFQ